MFRQIKTKREILDDVVRGQVDLCQRAPREWPCRFRRVGRPAAARKAKRAYVCVQVPGEFGDALRVIRRRRPGAWCRPTGPSDWACGKRGKACDRRCRHAAIGVDDDDHLGRLVRQMREAEIKGKTLAAAHGIVPLDDLGPCGARDGGGVVRAVVGDDKRADHGR